MCLFFSKVVKYVVLQRLIQSDLNWSQLSSVFLVVAWPAPMLKVQLSSSQKCPEEQLLKSRDMNVAQLRRIFTFPAGGARTINFGAHIPTLTQMQRKQGIAAKEPFSMLLRILCRIKVPTLLELDSNSIKHSIFLNRKALCHSGRFLSNHVQIKHAKVWEKL